MHEWFSNNRKPKRIYNYNPKHGENGVGNRKDESPLLCSRQEAETLLPNAVGTSVDAALFYYDKKHGHYIEFKNENTAINSYHAFHIADNIVCHRVPKEVIKKIKLIIHHNQELS